MLKYLVSRGPGLWQRPRPLHFERVDRLSVPMWNERIKPGQLILATIVAMVMMAFGPSAYADLYIIGFDSQNVLRYNETTGDFIDEFVSFGNSGVTYPVGLLFGPDGNLYVSSRFTNSIMRYDGTTGAFVDVFASGGGLDHPAGFIFARDGNLYVNSQLSDSVLRYKGTTGDYLDAFVPEGLAGLYRPRRLVFGPDGNLYVNHYGHTESSVLRYDGITGAPLPSPGSTGAIFASIPPAEIAGFVFGPDSNLYVSFYASNSVGRYNGTTGEFMDTFVSSGSGGLNGPIGLIFGPDNHLYVASNNSNSVLRYDGTTGAFIDAFIPHRSGGLTAPTYLSFTHTDPTTLAYIPPPHSRFLITAPPTAVSGTPFEITVTALDPSGNIDTTYQGTVTFSTTDPDSGVVLPADYTFTTGDGGDNGVHTFSGGITLITVGDQILTATDKVNGITGSATITVGPGP